MGDYFTYQEPTPFIETFLLAIAILVFFILVGWIIRIIFQEISMQLTIGKIKSKKSIKDCGIPEEILEKYNLVPNKNIDQQNPNQENHNRRNPKREVEKDDYKQPEK
jgi:hypothetical protein